MKRYLICLIGGFVAAGICVGGMISGGRVEMTQPLLLASIGNRVLIGFVLGISGWRIHWALHGLMVGLIVTLSSSLAILPQLDGFLLYTVAGMIYGFLIELVATKAFKAGNY